jgi:hypothetical protein
MRRDGDGPQGKRHFPTKEWIVNAMFQAAEPLGRSRKGGTMILTRGFLMVFGAVLMLLGADSAAKAQAPIEFTCPNSMSVGIKILPNGWNDVFGSKSLPLGAAAADPASRMMSCDYGDFAMFRPFPDGYTCTVNRTQRPRVISCTPTKPPPIKIPGKKSSLRKNRIIDPSNNNRFEGEAGKS